MPFFDRLQALDRRTLYVLLALCVSLPFFIPFGTIRPKIARETRSFYDTVEAVANDPVASKKLVVLSVNYSPSTLAENGTQNEALVAHLMARKLRFAIVSIDPQGRELAQTIAERLAKKSGYVYGTNYCNWGFIPPASFQTWLKALVRDVPGTVKNDYKGAAIASLPVMEGIRTVDDIGLIVDITPSSTLAGWVQFVQRTGTKPVPTLYCPTAVMAPEGVPYLDSGQLQGMLIGLKGANEYETLLKDTSVITEAGLATRFSWSLSLSYILILSLIVLGNVGMFAARRQSGPEERSSSAGAARGREGDR